MRLVDASGRAGRGDAAPARRDRGPAAVIVGQDSAVEQFASAWATRKLHHAWLLAGPKGVGKASFAHAAARRVLADAAGRRSSCPASRRPTTIRSSSWSRPAAIPTCAGSSGCRTRRADNLARNISVDQVRELGEFMGMTAALSPWRVAVIDSDRRARTVGRQRAAQNARGAAGEHACSSSSATRRAGCCRPSARAAAGSISKRSTMTP